MGELFREAYGVTPGEYVNSLRLNEAKRRLRETREPIINIAYSTGFGSVSSFYRFLQKSGRLFTGCLSEGATEIIACACYRYSPELVPFPPCL